MQITTGIRISFIILATVCSAAAADRTIYVDDTAAGNNDGTSWENAYIYLQDALADANSSEKPVEVLVAQGTYKPDEGIVAIPEFDWRTLSFQLINGVKLKGGYAGASSPDPNARNIELYKTILSGDLDGDDIDVNNLQDSGTPWIQYGRASDPNPEDDTSRVVTGSTTDETAVLDGFTITAGGVDQSYHERFAGMYIDAGSPTVTNCAFNQNSAIRNGGGVFCLNNSHPTFIQCTFTLNYAFCGGGMCNYDSNPTLTNCKFIDNYTTNGATDIFHHGGGGIYNRRSSPILNNCTFRENSSSHGSGMYNYESNPVLINCIFIGNTGYYGSGIENLDSNPVLTNCTFSGNFTKEGDDGAISGGSPTLVNCILWGNTPPQISYSSYTTISYSNIQGGWEGNGEGNIDDDPLFAVPGYWADANDPNIIVEPNDPNAVWVDGDYHLKSETGRWDMESESWVIDDVTSPCIDAGDPDSGWGSEIWPHGERINMGAYGGTPEAGLSPQPQSMSLPDIAYIYKSDSGTAQDFKSFLASYGCRTTLIRLNEVTSQSMDSFDLIIIANDTEYLSTWNDPEIVAAIEDSSRPVLGLGEGGYYYFGVIELSIGYPNGGHGSADNISVIDPNNIMFDEPYPVEIPVDRVLQLYTQSNHVALYFWPAPPDTVTVLAGEAGNPGYYPIVIERNRYLLWGFTESPDNMTETGKRVFINTVITTANTAW